jgi:hypothetical protein
LNKLGLAHVRLARDRHLRTFADQPATLRVAEQRADLAFYVAKRGGRFAGGYEVVPSSGKSSDASMARDQIEQIAVESRRSGR